MIKERDDAVHAWDVGVQTLRFEVWIWGLRLRDWGLRFGAQGLRFGVYGFGA